MKKLLSIVILILIVFSACSSSSKMNDIVKVAIENEQEVIISKIDLKSTYSTNQADNQTDYLFSTEYTYDLSKISDDFVEKYRDKTYKEDFYVTVLKDKNGYEVLNVVPMGRNDK